MPRNKTKARLEAGLLQFFIVGLAYFASLAIWCARRETFRLAAFL